MKIEMRNNGTTSTDTVLPEYQESVLGWFMTTRNVFGWVVTELSAYDKQWLEGCGVDTTNVYRTFSDNGNTNIARFNFVTGTFAFIDGEHYEATDAIKFERATRYSRFLVDTTDTRAVIMGL